MKRQSLFDALNVYPGDGITIKLTSYSSGTRIYVTVGNVIHTLTMSNPTITILKSVFKIDGYIQFGYGTLFDIIGADGSTIASGGLDGIDHVIDERVVEIRLYNSVYATDDHETKFDCVIGTGGILAALSRQHDTLTWLSGDMDADYIGSNGSKACSNLVMAYLQKYGEDVDTCPPIKVLSNDAIEALARLVWNRFGDAWTHIHDVLVAEYAPLENYNMVENEDPALVDIYGASDDYEVTHHREINSRNVTETEDMQTDSDIYGFNSSTAVPESKVTTGGTVTSSGDKEDNFEDSSESQKGVKTVTHGGTRELRRSGNIGVTTSQQMLESEVALRIKNHLDDIIYNDLNQILTTAGYAPVFSEEIKFI